MASWTEAGQDPALFWHLTLREIKIVMTGAARRIEREVMQSEVNAWLGARLVMIGYHKPKKFPKFSAVSSVKTKRREQSWKQQKALVEALNAAFGGKVIRK
ncbi:hypothetical protein [Roseovarius sp. MMSF_3350]|uniref:hypothetical protein n=1 Tax=Roseovarius sp. MMSF_3350 TaxID=3046706 RepID=UPI00273E6C6F|nr:hypothetical protein [Roseovarius sp. MMSF_3350]